MLTKDYRVKEEIKIAARFSSDSFLKNRAAKELIKRYTEDGDYEELFKIEEDEKFGNENIRKMARGKVDESMMNAIEIQVKDGGGHWLSSIAEDKSVPKYLREKARSKIDEAGMNHVKNADFHELRHGFDSREGYGEEVRNYWTERLIEECVKDGCYGMLINIAGRANLKDKFRSMAREGADEAAMNYTKQCIKDGFYHGLQEMAECEGLSESVRNKLKESIPEAAMNRIKREVDSGSYFGIEHIANDERLDKDIRNKAKESLDEAIINEMKRRIDWGEYGFLEMMIEEDEFSEEVKDEAKKRLEEATKITIKKDVESGWYKGLITIAKDKKLKKNVRDEAGNRIDEAAMNLIESKYGSYGRLKGIIEEKEISEEIKNVARRRMDSVVINYIENLQKYPCDKLKVELEEMAKDKKLVSEEVRNKAGEKLIEERNVLDDVYLEKMARDRGYTRKNREAAGKIFIERYVLTKQYKDLRRIMNDKRFYKSLRDYAKDMVNRTEKRIDMLVREGEHDFLRAMSKSKKFSQKTRNKARKSIYCAQKNELERWIAGGYYVCLETVSEGDSYGECFHKKLKERATKEMDLYAYHFAEKHGIEA